MNEQMDMITHQAISIHFKPVSLRPAKSSQKTLIVILVAEQETHKPSFHKFFLLKRVNKIFAWFYFFNIFTVNCFIIEIP
ncbi:hypothetical protein HY00_10990 [Peptococcaceae bacterium SCADC1_2_3]|nr:hypothetical protein HY00_10990 [Peptococcaceae bacterium SCADC1_2_3]